MDVVSSDGTLFIRLEPPGDAALATIETEAGLLTAPDFVVTIRDGFAEDPRGVLAS